MSLLKLKIKLILNYLLFRRKLGYLGSNVSLSWNIRLHGCRNIKIFNNVHVGSNCWLAALPLTGDSNCQLVLRDHAIIGDFNHIYSTSKIIIEKYALTANYVYISDNLHGYENPHVPITLQPIKQLKPVIIGEGSWIGEHVSIIGASVGKNSVVGANSVVTHDIPDFCVAVGAPAKIIKKFDPVRKGWFKTFPDGSFV